MDILVFVRKGCVLFMRTGHMNGSNPVQPCQMLQQAIQPAVQSSKMPKGHVTCQVM